MISTDKEQCIALAQILAMHGLNTAVLCPGARDLPLIQAFADCKEIKTIPYIDERSAAFFALGVSEISRRPVAIVCTSGSAILNLAPAIAEAYYKNIPLIAISADRPMEWIDQKDSQTIRQSDVLAGIVKASYNLAAADEQEAWEWKIRRDINEAILIALKGCPGPVHINVPLALPLDKTKEYNEDFCSVNIKDTPLLPNIDPEELKVMTADIQSASKVLIVAGGNPPSSRLSMAMEKLSNLDNVVILCENLSNLHLADNIGDPQTLLSFIGKEYKSELSPDILIYFGDPIVSANLKSMLRDSAGKGEQWYVGMEENLIDTFKGLTRRIKMNPADFFVQLCASLRMSNQVIHSDYRYMWKHFSLCQETAQKKFFGIKKDWTAISAMNSIIDYIPDKINVQVSNGLSVRYLMTIRKGYRFHRVDCNRGVSGIEGSTSTAIGAASCFSGTTVLFSGDMSARCDIQGIMEASRHTRNFKMVVFSNGGGNIFKLVSSTSESAIRDKFLYSMPLTDWKNIAVAFGWRFFSATDFKELEHVMPGWFEYDERPSLLVVETDSDKDTEIYKEFKKIRIDDNMEYNKEI